MYSEWPSIESEVVDKCRSVLHTYPSNVGRDVAKCVVSSLMLTPSLSGNVLSPNGQRSGFEGVQTLPHPLSTKEQVKWTMEVICFGLSLTLTEYETLSQSVSIYLDWLSVISTPKSNVPVAIKSEPFPYVRDMIFHLENLFIPRADSGVGQQLGLCQTVLHAMQTLVHDAKNLDRKTWESILMFVLNVSNTLLSPPAVPNGLAEQMCEQLMQTLFDVWMLSCCHSFPTPSLWKTARMLFCRWRHHPAVVDWWSRITSALTARLLVFMYGPRFPQYKVAEEDAKYIPKDMDDERIAQTWFRVLHLINDPVELSNTNTITKSPMFMDLTLYDPQQHSCLRMLPYIFLKAIKGVSSLVDAFLGLTNDKRYEVTYPNILLQIATPITPTTARKSGKFKKVAGSSSAFPKPPASPVPSSTSPSVSVSGLSVASATTPLAVIDMRPNPAPSRPQCNSILHLFGKWLFDAAVASVKFEPRKRSSSDSRGRASSIPYSISSSSSASVLGGAQPNDNLVSNPMFDNSDFPESSEAGRAEACGTLCRLMCCKKTAEHILPVYLSRFYLVLSHGLLGDSKQVLASIILNSTDMMRIDLPGVTSLVPALLNALETILPDKELQLFRPYLNTVELRRASIHLLISMLPLPLHFTTLPIEDVQELWMKSSDSAHKTSTTFISLKKQLFDLLIGALQCESDPVNTQMILGALLLSVHDLTVFEQAVAADGDSGDLSEAAGVTTPNELNNNPGYTASMLFVKIIHLVSQKLDSWKSDVSISLAALELLSGLAKAKVSMPDHQECRFAVQNLCQYIFRQCERPPPQHKRELHSMIVAAFHTLGTWLMQHPHLMDEKDCLYEVLEIIELGISGSKSKPDSTSSDPNVSVMKADKDLNPVSMRVLEAAEGLLSIVFEYVGAFPSPCSPSSTCSLLDERSLLLHASGANFVSMQEGCSAEQSMAKAVPRFRYFCLHGGLLLSILEQSLGNEQEPAPTVTLIIRSSSGRKVWTMQLRQTPRQDKLSPASYLTRPMRPNPINQKPTYQRMKHRYFPPEVDNIPKVKADCSIPPLQDVPDEEQAIQIEKLHHLIELQKRYDDDITSLVRENPEKMPECIPAEATQEFQTARLLLSHLNFLTLDALKAQPQARRRPDLVMLNSNDPSFVHDLEAFDSMPTRNHDTVFIFYVKSGQNERKQILENVSESCNELQPAFTEFLLSLGWPVDVEKHPGWRGRVSGSWKLNGIFKHSETESIDLNSQAPAIFNGDRYILYYADTTTEVAFIVPSLPKQAHSSSPAYSTVDSLNEKANGAKLTLDLSATRSMIINPSQESPTSPTVNSKPKKVSLTTRPNLQPMPDTRVAVVWCEAYDTCNNFSPEILESDMFTEQETPHLQTKAKDPLVILMIHPLKSGLFRIQVYGQSTAKGGVAVPLISGMVVSRRTLGTAVRMTAMNVCQRRRLASDSYNPPHIRRKLRINDLLSKYQRRCTEPEFFTAMFTDKKRDGTLGCSVSSSSSCSIASTHSAFKQAASVT